MCASPLWFVFQPYCGVVYSVNNRGRKASYHGLLLPLALFETLPVLRMQPWQTVAVIGDVSFTGSTQRQRLTRRLHLQVPQPADLATVRPLRFGDVFVDENTGWGHLCDGTCDLQIRDDAGERLVCPLTGRVHGRVFGDEGNGECASGGGCGDEGAAAAAAMTAMGLGADVATDQDMPTGLGALRDCCCCCCWCWWNPVLLCSVTQASKFSDSR